MSGPAPYRVSYSAQALQRLRELTATALARGDGPAFLAALREFQRRLVIYPQFGEPLADLTRHPGQVWLGLVGPVVMRYGVFDEQRAVVVSAPPALLKRGGS